jgi:hypothetical protein
MSSEVAPFEVGNLDDSVVALAGVLSQLLRLP